ncbi:MAG: hypothetical protein K2X35_20700 [Bryobacteraceae bacterium]|jgi:hypothetical protein|nr:hypothetical protein [Bryobacteraceae bacterium]
MNARTPRLVLAKPFLKRLEGAGIYCQTWVTAERQARTARWVLRAVESGGASRDVGRYIGFFAITGDRLPWLQRLDRITASGAHAVTVADELLSVEMARCEQTYQLLIVAHRLGTMQESKRPAVLSSVLYRGVDGQLSPELRQQNLTPEFFSRSGEVRPIPERYVDAVRLVTAGVTCINCRHAHALVEKLAPISAAS